MDFEQLYGTPTLEKYHHRQELKSHSGCHFNQDSISRVFVRAYADKVEIPYYSSVIFEDVCICCVSSGGIITEVRHLIFYLLLTALSMTEL